VRIGEETTILIYGISTVVYLFCFFLEFDFILNGDIDINIEEAYTKEIQALEPFILWNFWYFAMLFVVSLFPPYKPDFYELTIHHLIAMALIAAAFFKSWLSVSVWVILINAIFDIFLSLSRIAYKLDHWSQVPFFAIAVIIHFILRVKLFPYKIITTILTSKIQNENLFLHPSFFFTTLLWLLFVYWGYCMIRVSYLRLWKKEYKVDYSDGDQNATLGEKITKEE
jgi:hypothetical protein